MKIIHYFVNVNIPSSAGGITKNEKSHNKSKEQYKKMNDISTK